MWRSGAPQRRVARGAFPGADAPTCCYTPLHYRDGVETVFFGPIVIFVESLLARFAVDQ